MPIARMHYSRPPPGGHGSVLVVDDDEAIRESIADALRDEGYDVVCAANGAEALRALSWLTPRLVLLDLMMPVMSGWEFLEHVQADAHLSHIPVVVVSAMGAPGASMCIQKPLDLDRLLHAVAEYATP